ncbi:hypothetical protein [Segatella bryantii]|uniref:hypothetical protein n=1 Tax=Segatella bryantii TaxID=77095 RepID=UPI00241ECD88|nr:hypothetical protein [Segatella bryantii]
MKILFSTKYCLLIIIIALCMIFTNSCSEKELSKEELLIAQVDSFANYYYNWRFKDAMPYCTSTSEKWLKYASSNVHDVDIDTLRNQTEGASCEIEDVEINENTNTATVKITVKNFLQMDTIGTSCHMINEGSFTLQAIYINRNWKIRMEGLPQNEKQNHD